MITLFFRVLFFALLASCSQKYISELEVTKVNKKSESYKLVPLKEFKASLLLVEPLLPLPLVFPLPPQRAYDQELEDYFKVLDDHIAEFKTKLKAFEEAYIRSCRAHFKWRQKTKNWEEKTRYKNNGLQRCLSQKN